MNHNKKKVTIFAPFVPDDIAIWKQNRGYRNKKKRKKKYYFIQPWKEQIIQSS